MASDDKVREEIEREWHRMYGAYCEVVNRNMTWAWPAERERRDLQIISAQDQLAAWCRDYGPMPVFRKEDIEAMRDPSVERWDV